MDEKLLLGAKALGWAVGGGALTLLVDPAVVHSVAATGGVSDLVGLPSAVGNSIYGMLVGVLIWALRKSDGERVKEATEFGLRLDAIHSSGKKEIAEMRQDNRQLVMLLLEFAFKGGRSDDRRR